MTRFASRRGAFLAVITMLAGLVLWPAPVSAAPPAVPTSPSAPPRTLGFTGLDEPRGLTVDAAGNAYVADSNNNRVVKLLADHSGQQVLPFTGLTHPSDVAVDGDGNVYVADAGNARVLKLPAGGGAQTTLPFTGLFALSGIAVDQFGTVYITDQFSPLTLGNGTLLGKVWKMAPGGPQTEVNFASIRQPTGIDVGPDLTIYVVESHYNRIRVSTYSSGFFTIENPNFSNPAAVAADPAGNLYVANQGNNKVIELDPNLHASVVPFRALSGPTGVATQGTADVWVSDTLNDRVLQLHPPAAELRVTTSPAVPADILVDGIVRDAWGLNWAQIPEGDHTVCFGRVVGYITPACQDVTLTTASATTVVGTYQQAGSLRVITDPPVDSQISVTLGESDWISPRNNWGLWTDFAPETYTVCFGKVAGFDPPPCRVVQVTAGATTTTTGTFTPNPSAAGPPASDGRLRVTTDPPVPAEISVGGWVRNTWGLDWLSQPFSSSDICFGEVPGYTRPAVPCTQYSQQPGETTTLVGHYAAKGYLKVATNPAVPGTVSIDGVPSNAYGVWVGIAPGSHDVCFGPVPGYVAPPCQNGVSVTASATTSITGTYVPT